MIGIPIGLAHNERESASTGPLDHYYTFKCENCSTETAAMVRATGWGRGPDQCAAHRHAEMHATGVAQAANMAAACPRCEKLHWVAVGIFERAAKKARLRKILARVLPIAAAIVALVIALPYAIEDRQHSLALFFVAFTAAGAAGALTFVIANMGVDVPTTDPNGVWFSLDPSQGPSSWFPARRGEVPVIWTPDQKARNRAALLTPALLFAALLGGLVWSWSFRTIYVINTAGVRGPLTIQIDGKHVGVITVVGGGSTNDVPFQKFQVRAGSSHRVVLTGPGDFEGIYDLDPKKASKGWVLAPAARARGLCIVSFTQHYGRGPLWRDSENGILNTTGAGDRVALDDKFDVVFTPPPESIQTKDAHQKKTTLRAVDCSALERDSLVSFGNGSPVDP